MSAAGRAALAGVLVLSLAVSGCSGGTGSASTTPSPTRSPGPTPAAAATAPTPPAGWTAAREGDLVFALPPGFTPRPDGSGIAGATHQWTKTDDPQLPLPPAAAVFVETGAVGPLGVRTELLRSVRSADLGAQPFGPAQPVQVPGSMGANRLEWRWDYDVLADHDPVASRQVEVLVQTAGDRQYGLMLGAPSTFLTDDVVDAFTSSIAVVPVDGAA
jgi:hypothetical protein